MTTSARRVRGSAIARCALLVVAVLSIPALPAHAGDCDNTSEGFKPLTDLGAGTYRGHQGGLYPGGTNKRPAGHTTMGVGLARSYVVPRDAAGKPDAGGKLAFLSVGMSNAEREFDQFVTVADDDPIKSRRVVVVNGAQAGMEAGEVAAPRGRYWSVVDERLGAAGVTPQQVGAIWLKETDGSPNLPFEAHIEKLENDLATIVQAAKERFPNLWIVYVSTRTYGGYALTKVSPEPWAYQDGFAAKGLIERQLSGTLSVGSDSAPWLSWGPYMWADGTVRRSDGLRWLCSDFVRDGVHPSRTGTAKVSGLLLKFLHSDGTAKLWYTGKGQTPTAGLPSALLSTPSPSGSPASSPTATPTDTATPGGSQAAAPKGSSGPGWTPFLLGLAPLGALVAYRFLRRSRSPNGPNDPADANANTTITDRRHPGGSER